jgi:hypothetical protein
MAATAIVPAVLAIGFIGQLDWARDLWPFEISQLDERLPGFDSRRNRCADSLDRS